MRSGKGLAMALGGLCALWACDRSAPDRKPGAPAPGTWPLAIEAAGSARTSYERVVLVTIDTLRADHVSCYGYPRETTPFLDQLAAQGARFTRAFAAVSHTTPSHATILTGLVPAVHGVFSNGESLDPSAADLATMFAAAGFETAAFLNVDFLKGVAGSFDTVRVRGFEREGGRKVFRGGEYVVQDALEWAGEGRRSGRFLLWVHLYDPHSWTEVWRERHGDAGTIWQGRTPEDFRVRLRELHGLTDRPAGEALVLHMNADEKMELPAEEFWRCIDAYDEQIRYADRQLERLYRGLEARSFPGSTLWIVTSDHGEGLASHGFAGHGPRIYQEQLGVPLVLHASDRSLAPRRIEAVVSHVDLLPTLAEALGARVSASAGLFEGRSLWPLLRGEAGEERAAFSQRRPSHDSDRSELFALQTEGHKYILHEPGDDEFFDLTADPRELRNRIGSEGQEEERLRRSLEERLRRYREVVPARSGEVVPDAWLEELQDLGYAR